MRDRGLVRWIAIVAVAGVVLAGTAALTWPLPLRLLSGIPGTERLYTRWLPPEPPARLQGILDVERQAFQHVAGGLDGVIIWSSNREGNHDLYLVDLATGAQRRLTDHPHVDFFSRVSPDGRLVSFLRSTRPWVSFRELTAWDVYVIGIDGSDERLVARGGYHPTWRPDGRGLVYVKDNAVVSLDLETGEETVLQDAARPPIEGEIHEAELGPDGLLAVTLRHAHRETVGVLDPRAGTYTPASTTRSCQITWVPGTRDLVWVDPRGEGGNRVMRASADDPQEEVFIDLPGSHSHEYFPRVTADGQWLIWGATAEGHEHDRADYEIFLWRIGAPWDTATRLTYSPANDQWPELYIRP